MSLPSHRSPNLSVRFLLFPQLKISSVNGARLAVSGAMLTSVFFLKFLGLLPPGQMPLSLSLSFYLVWQTAPVFFPTQCLSCSLILPTTDIWKLKTIKTKGTSLFLV